ncbi:hypothetical protein O181_021250 [Austropuccinia psidii MF-1]|uniref:Uncharacterized protein n=1 Tax=Austropuccinia psidii MF-1 TaxID=1389203 RepID=A0A9Q3CEA5_9BASI|nr:hypothetical protein [Austropuccinia psidii MF-1]
MPTETPPKQLLQESLSVPLDFMPEYMPRVPLRLLESKILNIAMMPLKVSWHILLSENSMGKKHPKLLKCWNHCSIQHKLRPNYAARVSLTGLESFKTFTTKSKTNCKAEGQLMLLLTPSKKKRLFGPLQGMLRDKLPPCFSLTPFP